MKSNTAGLIAALAAGACAAKDSRTFAVLRFNGDGFLTEGRVDPVVDPGRTATHMHGIMGGSNFDTTIQNDQLLNSKCTTAKIKNDNSNYWAPQVYFQDPQNGTFTKVPLFYMNVYYFFEPTDDEIKAFPPGLKMLSGDAKTRDPPAFGGAINLDPGAGALQPVQWTCPRSSYNPPSYPAKSDGTTAGMQDPQNEGAGAGFPLYPCDGYASPLRQDIHFPSCYNPEAGLDDYKNNMKFPTVSGFKQNCPKGWIHVPHMFYELYWNTPLFDARWTPDGKKQPFVLSNGDLTGYSSHGDFVAGWDTKTLQTIIDTCDAGDLGMDHCPQIPGGLNTDSDCKIPSPISEAVSLAGLLTALPGDNPVTGWGKGGQSGGTGSGDAGSSYPASSGSGATGSSDVTGKKSTASSKAEATYATGGKKAVAIPTNAAESPAPGGTGDVASPAEGRNRVNTVYDVVTVTSTMTAWVEPTAPAKRHVLDHHHMARHLRGRMGPR